MPERVRKPEWLKINIGANERYTETKRIVDIPLLAILYAAVGVALIWGNAGGKGTATFMIGGEHPVRAVANSATHKPAARTR